MFSVGVVLQKSFEVFFKNAAAFLLLSLVLSLPSLVYSWISLNNLLQGGQQSLVSTLIERVIAIFVHQLIAATIIYGVVQELRGRRVSLSVSLQRGIGLLLPVVGVALLVGLVIALAMVVPMLPALLIHQLLWVGLPVAVVLAFVAMIRLWVAIPAAVVERPGVVASLRRSAELTSGHRWAIFGLFLIVTLLGGVVSFAVQKIFAPGEFSAASFRTVVLVSYVVETAFTAFYGVLTAVSYYALRVTKEGIDIEQIAQAFD